MNKKSILYCIDYKSYSNLLLKLEVKCDRLTETVSEVRKQMVSLSPEVDTLIDSLGRSAKELYEQSVLQRKYVERNVNGKYSLHLIGGIGDGR